MLNNGIVFIVLENGQLVQFDTTNQIILSIVTIDQTDFEIEYICDELLRQSIIIGEIPFNYLEEYQIIDEYKSEISAKQINIQNKFTKAAFLTQGNAFLISLMLRNLVDNAVKYSPNGAKIEIKLNNQSLSVCNSGIKVDEEQLSKLGQRFYRPSGQTAKGSGLGLAIVHKIASAHHCQTKFYNTKTGFCVSIFN